MRLLGKCIAFVLLPCLFGLGLFLFQERYGSNRPASARSLRHINPRSREIPAEILELAGDPDPKVRTMTAKRLRTATDDPLNAVPYLVAALRDKDAQVRAAAAATLTQIWLDKRTPRGLGPSALVAMRGAIAALTTALASHLAHALAREALAPSNLIPALRRRTRLSCRLPTPSASSPSAASGKSA